MVRPQTGHPRSLLHWHRLFLNASLAWSPEVPGRGEYSGVAQLVEQQIVNLKVGGSSPPPAVDITVFSPPKVMAFRLMVLAITFLLSKFGVLYGKV